MVCQCSLQDKWVLNVTSSIFHTMFTMEIYRTMSHIGGWISIHAPPFSCNGTHKLKPKEVVSTPNSTPLKHVFTSFLAKLRGWSSIHAILSQTQIAKIKSHAWIGMKGGRSTSTHAHPHNGTHNLNPNGQLQLAWYITKGPSNTFKTSKWCS